LTHVSVVLLGDAAHAVAAGNAAMRLTPPMLALRSMHRYAAWRP
jgi:hypothetical protein